MKMGGKLVTVTLNTSIGIKIRKWKVKEGMVVSARQVIFMYEPISTDSGQEPLKFKCSKVGTVRKLLAREGDVVNPGDDLLQLEECTHPTVMKDMCAECGADLRQEEQAATNASVPMVHSIPELKVSEEQAQILGKADEKRLISDKKLVLLVDLDQTLIHTTNDNIPPNLKDVYHFQLYGPHSPWYHTRIRPRTPEFLKEISKYYELHICTFGARNYAHMIAMFLDPKGEFFSHRILSRDECFNANSKTANLKALFPCGDNMVCIIDDREDVWNYAPNLIHVKPYHFFKHTGDINAPPGLAKKENDEIDGYDFTNLDKLSKDKKVPEENAEKKPVQPKAKVEILGESTTDKDTDDEVEKEKEAPKTQSDNKEDIEKITGDLQLSEDDSEDSGEEKSEREVKAKEANTEETGEKGETAETVVSTGTTDTLEQPVQPEAETETKEKEGNDKPSKDTSDENQNVNNEEAKPEEKSKEDLIEVEDTDDYLMYLEDILKKIHESYYEAYDSLEKKENGIPDLKIIIPEVKKKVLENCNLVFSGLVPSHVPLTQSKPYLVAISLGATVSAEVSASCTHLVAARPGTAKVNSSRRIKGINIVTPLWLWHCAERWERLEEKLYPLGRGSVANRVPPAHCSSPEHNAVEAEQYSPAMRSRTPSGRFIDTINPLLTFSSEDMKKMDQEVEEMFNDDDDDDETESDDNNKEINKIISRPSLPEADESSTSSSEDSLSGSKCPKGWSENKIKARKRKAAETTTCTESDVDEESPSVKFRRGEPLPSDLDLGEDSQDSPGSDEPLDDVDDGDWNMMGAQLEREFLSGE